MRFSDPYIMKLKKTRSCVRYTSLKNIDYGIYRNRNPSRWIRNLTLVFTIVQNLCQRWYQQSITWKMRWGLPSSGRIWKRLGHEKQIWKSRLTKFLQKSPNFFRNSWNFFHVFLRPQCTFGTNSYKSFITGTPSKRALFQKTWWKRVKEYSFNLFTERVIKEDCVAVILPPQLTL